MNQLKEFTTDRINKALQMATIAHNGQVRKGNKLPYIIHPVQVAELVYAYGGSEDQIIVALLHDTIEDTKVTFEDIQDVFGLKIAYMVLMLTSDKETMKQFASKAEYLVWKMTAMTIDVLFIKLADRIANITGIGLNETKQEFKIKYLNSTKDIINGINPVIASYCLGYVEGEFDLDRMFNLLKETYENEMRDLEGK